MLNRRSFRRILRSVTASQPTAYPVGLKKVYEWVSMLTMESKRYFDEGDFYLTHSVKRLIFKLENLKQGLIGVIGLQGVGKTSTLNFLSERFIEQNVNAFLLSWTPETLQSLKNDSEVEDYYETKAYHQAVEKARAYASANRPLLGRIPNQFSISDIKEKRIDLHGVELMLGTAEREKLKEEAVYDYLSNINYLFIDLPDYSKKHRGEMNRDLRAVETLWKRIQKGDEFTGGSHQVLVLGIQKEMFGGHFFFGKMDVVELEPLKPEELVFAYKQKWKTFDVIAEDALFYIAQLSRGVFRRFLMYIQRCIEESFIGEKGFPITTDTVKAAISLDLIVKDMDLELADLFKNKEQKLNCVKLLNLLREREEVNQRQIAEALDIDDMAVSRIVKTLEANGYIRRKHGQGAEWLVSLA